MRAPVEKQKLREFFREFARVVKGPGSVFLAGGATAVWFDWRPKTIDIDLVFDPEPLGAFEALREVMIRLDSHVELASPKDFLPPLPGWRERSIFLERVSPIDFFHYDLYSQALAKISRGFETDQIDVRSMFSEGHLDPSKLAELFEAIRPQLIRYPRIEEAVLCQKVKTALETLGKSK